MNPILVDLLSSTATSLVPVAEGLAATAFGKLIASGESKLTALEASHPVVQEAVSALAVVAGALSGGNSASIASAAVADVEKAVAPLITGFLAHLVAKAA